MKNIRDFELVIDRKELKALKALHYIRSNPEEPKEYPCFVQIQTDGHENPYLEFYYKEDITAMACEFNKQ